MKKLFITCSLLLIACTLFAQGNMPANMPTGGGMPGGMSMPTQSGMFNAMPVANGVATIDGKNTNSAIYSYTGADSVLTVNFTNVANNESLIVFYNKTTASNLLITFPAGTTTKQPTQLGGVTVNGTVFTLTSSASGQFQIMVKNNNGVNQVTITRNVQ